MLGSICCQAAVSRPNWSNADFQSPQAELAVVRKGSGLARLPTGAKSAGGAAGGTRGPRAAAGPSAMAAQIDPRADDALLAAPARLLSAGVYLGMRWT